MTGHQADGNRCDEHCHRRSHGAYCAGSHRVGFLKAAEIGPILHMKILLGGWCYRRVYFSPAS